MNLRREPSLLIKRSKTAADYAAIAVAPVLIFLMISALTLFVCTLLYRGGYSGRVQWVVLFFTMGSVAVARLAIEQDRKYAMGYMVALSAAGVLVLSQFVGSIVVGFVLVALIVYLSDRIVFDCTLIDESKDSSGEGLIDSGRLFFQGSDSAKKDPKSSVATQPNQRKKRRTHQPGRTVMYLALAALPLFGLGQVWISDPQASASAQTFLGVYLFAALALLMTTSFLGLRRYLRQRGVDMPVDVTVGWLGGGALLVAAIVATAFLLPTPGRIITGGDPPISLAEAKDFAASRFGWGKEAAKKSTEGNASTSEDQDPEKEVGGQRPEKGAPAGKVGDGESGDGESGDGESGDGESGDGDSGDGESGDGESGGEESGGEESGGEESGGEESGGEESGGEESGGEESGGEESGGEESAEADANQREASDSNESSSSGQSGSSQSFGGVTSMVRGLLDAVRWLLPLALLAFVGFYLLRHGRRFWDWLTSLFAGRSDAPDALEQLLINDPTASLEPPRRFSEFRNPLGRDNDAERIIATTFGAADAWMRENVSPRRDDETPSEFAHRLRQQASRDARLAPLVGPFGRIVDAYNRLAYAKTRPNADDVQAARDLWMHLR
ncbi:DUF4129 domain-containing protein [Crateriforma conspicua]|uniref:Protein-glutamine gamma-glutamyltransferase-like C-terminal domain-containing protein n=1 Tax=Crateriforma conspicua TaxID=2527996 RepID=A0A5C5YAE4_9PLAN|nr:DUF4129 domain-containing protein [Crateriforma conspicua]TWT71929.1 hypothetical protein Pan14r_42460 [Crateriforma conspicua]